MRRLGTQGLLFYPRPVVDNTGWWESGIQGGRLPGLGMICEMSPEIWYKDHLMWAYPRPTHQWLYPYVSPRFTALNQDRMSSR